MGCRQICLSGIVIRFSGGKLRLSALELIPSGIELRLSAYQFGSAVLDFLFIFGNFGFCVSDLHFTVGDFGFGFSLGNREREWVDSIGDCVHGLDVVEDCGNRSFLIVGEWLAIRLVEYNRAAATSGFRERLLKLVDYGLCWHAIDCHAA